MGGPTPQRRAYLEMMERVSAAWLELFQDDTEFYATAYWDLFTALWLAGRPLRKTDAMASMRAVKSAHTAGKYVDYAVTKGLLIEESNPTDARSKLLRLAPEMKAKLDAFFDAAMAEVCDTAHRLEGDLGNAGGAQRG